jgi:hypothetical protein
MDDLLARLRSAYPNLHFCVGKQFCWSPETHEVFFKELGRITDADKQTSQDQKATWSLLHEVGHALLDHKSYKADFQLVRLEVAAWEKARELAKKFDIEIDEDHIQDCLDTYRDWLYQRSICPSCNSKCLQQGDYAHYRCFNCHTVWQVTPSLFARAYRKTKNVPQPLHPVFHLMD